MKKSYLVESPVVFDGDSHTYTLNGQMLSGVTPIISWLFPDTYKGIPQHVLDEAAKYGTMVHSKCELYDSMGIGDHDYTDGYAKMISDAGLEVVCSEYLVSDEHRVATCIDKVFADDSLGDIKTTSKVHELLVTIQLSINAYLYERQVGRKVKSLYLIWLPRPQYGKPELRELKRIPAEWCEVAINRYSQGESNEQTLAELMELGFVNTDKVRVEGDIPDGCMSLVDELIIIKKQLDFLSEREKEIKNSLLAAMQTAGEDKWSSDLIQFSRRAAYERKSIDSTALQKNEPEIFEKYQKVTKVAESLTYKVL